ncbi:hypothetical protein SDC9_154959 [bioreactor metagenome]|uniref:Uncharacterized protein n=1 Tax=bioreactor metagenome TaxID=1076179 RepID=A0A645F066_9ZZZZ
MEIINQKADERAEQPRGKDGKRRVFRLIPQVIAPGGKDRKESGNRRCHSRGQSVHSVGEVHGVYRRHHDEGGEHHVEPPGENQIGVQKWEIQIGGQISGRAQKYGERDGGGQLQKKLLRGRQAGILLFLYLGIIIQKPDGSENQREKEHHDPAPVSCPEVGRPDDEDRRYHGADEH